MQENRPNLEPPPKVDDADLAAPPVVEHENLSSPDTVQSETLDDAPQVESANLPAPDTVQSETLDSAPQPDAEVKLDAAPRVGDAEISPPETVESQTLDAAPKPDAEVKLSGPDEVSSDAKTGDSATISTSQPADSKTRENRGSTKVLPRQSEKSKAREPESGKPESGKKILTTEENPSRKQARTMPEPSETPLKASEAYKNSRDGKKNR